MTSDDLIIVGRFGRPYGIKGFIKLHSYTEPFDNILCYKPWYALIHHQWELLNLLHIDVKGTSIVVQLSNFTTRETVATLSNTEIGVPKAVLPSLEPGEFYWHQLIGMQVINTKSERIGDVVEILATGSNDVLVVKNEEQRHLIPYLLNEFIVDVQIEQRLIVVAWDTDI